jgi:hypothetical protein
METFFQDLETVGFACSSRTPAFAIGAVAALALRRLRHEVQRAAPANLSQAFQDASDYEYNGA